MVNDETKACIIDLLRGARESVSGERISRALGRSRVTVWKQIQILQELGYRITATGKGYRLKGDPDALFPWEIAGRRDRVHYFPVVDSTMNQARALARNDCPDFTVVIAERQDHGRGRLNRRWQSGEGGLFFTVVMRPDLPAALSYRFNFAASLALAQTLMSLHPVDVALKWPNDLKVSGKKIAGILSEMETESEMIRHVSVGIGLNVNNPLAESLPDAVSVRTAVGHPVSRKKILTDFLDRFEAQTADLKTANPVAEWKKLSDTPGKTVKIVTVKETIEGRAVDVSSEGALIVRLPDGTHRSVLYGDCFY